ncbi:Fic family protein [Candidatus Daviesbacteria bacterium]|nr:Fic family protein [Candidatus Daviesbacteria bacterium]
MVKAPEEILSGALRANEFDPDIFHSFQEIGNVYRCVTIEDSWLKDRVTPGILYISELHAKLFDRVPTYYKKGLLPLPPGTFRREDIYLSSQPPNFYSRGLDVSPLMDEYARELDKIIESLPRSPLDKIEDIIHQGAWSYYVFERIHPFLDGNGRIGRMILRRILRGTGLKDIIFSAASTPKGSKRSEEERNKHLDAMSRVSSTGNLAHLELYIARQLLKVYPNSGENKGVVAELQGLIDKKTMEVETQTARLPLEKIWPKFGDIDIHGSEDDLKTPAETSSISN